MQANQAREEKKYTYTTIIKQISEMVRTGVLTPGDRLPPERKLAELLGVSRGSLRQAFQALAERRIIESRQGDGTYLLTAPDVFVAGDTILDAINAQSGLLRHIIELRQMMEPQIAAWASQRINAEQLDRLKVVVCDQQRALLAGRETDPLDAEFHRQLTACCANPVLVQVMTGISSILDETRAVWLQSNRRLTLSVEGHLRIIDALEAGDATAAFAAMQSHIHEIETQLFDDCEE